MAFLNLDSPIEYLKGVGPQRGALLRKHLNIHLVQDLLFHYPFRYVDRTKFHQIKDINQDDGQVQIKAKVVQVLERGSGRFKPLIAVVKDHTGTIELVWFQGQKWIQPKLEVGIEFIFFGKVQDTGYGLNISHPEFDRIIDIDPKSLQQFEPVYSSGEVLSSKGLDSKGIRKLIKGLFQSINWLQLNENLPEYVIKKYHLPKRIDCLQWIHFPKKMALMEQAQNRLKFEEFFFIQLKIIQTKILRQQGQVGFKMSTKGDLYDTFYKNHLPFALTGAQQRVILEINNDLTSGRQMNRLLQGDVGSGKTIVALMIILIALGNGYQACMMAPTEVLAKQHFASVSEMVSGLPIQVCLLTSNVKGKEKKQTLLGLANGTIHIAIGTHALIEDAVQFQNLGMVVIDEQHRFGVEQRSKLWSKAKGKWPHVLVMTATPIPRTLAMTLYGDLDVSIIDELPPNRKEIQTIHIKDFRRSDMHRFMKEQIALGRQVYIVYPLIEESEALDIENLQMGYEKLLPFFKPPEYQISVVHGRLKPNDKNMEMQRFISGRAHIMVATTVIEVGVNVPNASIMVVENAERFGLSQLHQLRGRVGRGSDQSYCILMTADKIGKDSKARMEIMCSTNDGFKIAEADLEIRGPGNLTGTQQSGLVELKVADIVADNKILIAARNLAEAILQKDPHLNHPVNLPLRKNLNAQDNSQKWDRIS